MVVSTGVQALLFGVELAEATARCRLLEQLRAVRTRDGEISVPLTLTPRRTNFENPEFSRLILQRSDVVVSPFSRSQGAARFTVRLWSSPRGAGFGPLHIRGAIPSVTVVDVRGVRRSAEVTAASVFEAAGLGLAALRSDSWTEPIGPATRVEVGVTTTVVTHTLTVQQLERWATGAAASPDERLRKDRVLGLLRAKPVQLGSPHP